MVRFLVVRFSSIGDIVLTTPVVRMLKKQVEDAEVYYITKKSFAPFLEPNPYITKVFTISEEQSLSETLDEIQKLQIDYVVDLHNNLRSRLVKSRIKTLNFTFNKLNIKKWLMVNFKINRLPNVHIVDRYLDTIKAFDVGNDQEGLDYFIPEKDEISIRKILPESFHAGYVAFVIGAKFNTKQLHARKISSICKSTNLPIVLLGGPDEKEKAETIKTNTGSNVFNACGDFNINQSASLVKQAQVVITHDTGLMHVAAAFGKKIVSLWGNTIPEFGMTPYRPHPDSKIFQVDHLSCRPCSKIGFDKCPKGHFHCIEKLNEETIARYTTQLFKQA